MLNKCLILTSSINQPFADQSKKKILLNCVAQSFFTSSVKKKTKKTPSVLYFTETSLRKTLGIVMENIIKLKQKKP